MKNFNERRGCIILKVPKNQGPTFSLENTFLEKPQGGVKSTPALLGLILYLKMKKNSS